ncbi:MAG TPA: copper resistance protein CopC [Anaerolineales bacterium]|nr:copper resistance protein CopC [Anaerolineales bacterium]
MLRNFLKILSGLIALAALAVSVRPARAHADLLSASPAPNASLERSPVRIELFFSEPVDPSFTVIRVLDSTGKLVDNADTTVDPANPARATVTVRSLSDGIYTVSWKVLSAVDSHITSGAYPFAVGDVDTAALEGAAAAQQVNLSAGEVIFRWLTYLPVAALAGGVLFRRLAWDRVIGPARAEAADAGEVVFRAIERWALVLLVAAGIFGLLSQIGQVADQDFAMPWHPAAARLLVDTRFGVLWLVRTLLSFVLVVYAARPGRPFADALKLSALLGIMATFSLNSHAAAEPRPLLPVTGDLVHLASASAWVGGLVAFAGAMYALRNIEAHERTALTAALIPRFSNLAIASVALLALSGVYSAVLRVGSIEALAGTLYGRTLLVKSLLAMPALVVGGLNLTTTTPMMRSAAAAGGSPALVGRFRMLLSTEILFLSLVLLVVGFFAAIPPAQAVSTESAIVEQAQAGGLDLRLEISPGRVGLNTFRVTVSSGGDPQAGLREVALQFVPAAADLPPSEAVLDDRGGGLYETSGAYLSLPDLWQIQVSVRRVGEFDAFANFELPVGTDGSSALDWNRYAAFVLLLSAAAVAPALKGFRPEIRVGRPWIWLSGLALIGSAVFAFRLPSGTEPRFINPIPPNRESVMEGQAIYRVQCLSCHGPAGRGDGPVGLTLQPPPADLYTHTEPGVHPDGTLYEWISFGFGEASVMPQFENILTDEERWHVVNYIRTFSRPLEEETP